MSYQHFEKKIQDLQTLESDKEEDSEELSDNDEDTEEVGVSRRRKTRNKKPILDESEDEEEEEVEDEEHEDVDDDDSENDEGEEEEQEDETWKTEIKLMLEDIPNLTSRQKERKASEFLQMPKEEVLNKLEELNGRSSHRSSRPTRERRAPKRYHISDDDESDFEDAKENVKPAKRQKITRSKILESDDRSEENDSEEQNSETEDNFEAEITNGRQSSSRRSSNRRRTARRSKNLLDDEENFAEFDDFDDSFTAERPVRERKRPTRFSEDSHDSSNKKSVYAEGKNQTAL